MNSQARQLDSILADYAQGVCDDEELVSHLSGLQDASVAVAMDDFAAAIGELISRIEMIQFNLCAAERPAAIAGVIADYRKTR